MMKTIRNRSGFTLMELLVSMTIFLVVMGLASGIFLQTLRSQRAVVGIAEAMNNVTLALEQIAREVRTGFAFEDTGELTELRFRNGYGDYVRYRVIADQENETSVIGRCQAGGSVGCDDIGDFKPITSSGVVVEDIKFLVQNDPDQPPLVTTVIEVQLDANVPPLTIQTSVSSRIID